eukprot:gene21312-15794_t
MSRHKGLILEKPIEGFGSAEDLELRHGLQAFLDEKLGWLGLGHCDGGSTGSGSMEVFCFVVDGALALETLRRELASTAFRERRHLGRGEPVKDVGLPEADNVNGGCGGSCSSAAEHGYDHSQ